MPVGSFPPIFLDSLPPGQLIRQCLFPPFSVGGSPIFRYQFKLLFAHFSFSSHRERFQGGGPRHGGNFAAPGPTQRFSKPLDFHRLLFMLWNYRCYDFRTRPPPPLKTRHIRGPLLFPFFSPETPPTICLAVFFSNPPSGQAPLRRIRFDRPTGSFLRLVFYRAMNCAPGKASPFFLVGQPFCGPFSNRPLLTPPLPAKHPVSLR